jgi:hypothetical protein
MSYPELRLFAEMFNDVQQFRIATENKIRSGGIDAGIIGATLKHYEQAEHEMKLEMQRCFRRTVPRGVREWQKSESGIGEPLLARLLGQIGNPRIAAPRHWQGSGKGERILVADEVRPRRVSELWSYCGHGDPTRKRKAGMSAEDGAALGNPQAKMLVWNLATACLKAGVREDSTVAISHFGEVYMKRRAVTADRVHNGSCVRCGPSGKPAPNGSPLSKGHQLADALRIVGKEILRELWIAAA